MSLYTVFVTLAASRKMKVDTCVTARERRPLEEALRNHRTDRGPQGPWEKGMLERIVEIPT